MFALLQHPAGADLLQRLRTATSDPVEQIYADYDHLVAELLRLTEARWMQVRPLTGRMSFQPWRRDHFAALGVHLAALASAWEDGISLIDQQGAGLDWSLFWADGTHLTEEGHTVALEPIRSTLAGRALQARSRRDCGLPVAVQLPGLLPPRARSATCRSPSGDRPHEEAPVVVAGPTLDVGADCSDGVGRGHIGGCRARRHPDCARWLGGSR